MSTGLGKYLESAMEGKRTQEEALVVHKQAVHLFPDIYNSWLGLGHTLSHLKRYDEALAAYEHVLHLPTNDF